NTRASDIAEAAGVSHGTIFVHFPSMEALIEEVVAVYGQKIALRTHELACSSGSLNELLRAHLDAVMEYEPFYTRLILENRFLPVGARDCFIEVQSAVSLHFSRAAEREIPGSVVPLYMLFNMWVGLVHYYLTNGDLFAPEGNVISHCGEALINNYLKLLKGDLEK
ncbi:MAG: TetR/AcrR family transcriptional regulator, partial [Oscillospiraceae bacterium]